MTDLVVILDHFAGHWVVQSVQKLADDAESLGDHSTDFAGVIADFAALNGKVYDADSSKGGCQPKLLIIKST